MNVHPFPTMPTVIPEPVRLRSHAGMTFKSSPLGDPIPPVLFSANWLGKLGSGGVKDATKTQKPIIVLTKSFGDISKSNSSCLIQNEPYELKSEINIIL